MLGGGLCRGQSQGWRGGCESGLSEENPCTLRNHRASGPASHSPHQRLKHRTQKIRGVLTRLGLDLFSLPFLSPYQVQTAKQSTEDGAGGGFPSITAPCFLFLTASLILLFPG